MNGQSRCLSVVRLMVMLVPAVGCPHLLGATPSAEKALTLVPAEDGVEYDRPKSEEVPKCRIVPRKIGDRAGWVVEIAEGVVLRTFMDTNGDKVVDQWSYFKDGVEVYREMDSRSAGKANEFRWLHQGGSRWGVDNDGDGKIDQWKVLSPEEATAESVAALASRDWARFASVLLTPRELQALGLGAEKARQIRASIDKAETAFKAAAIEQTALTPASRWMQFTGAKPSLVPAGTDGSTKDLRVYENTGATVQTGGKLTHVQIGTLVQVGDVWKVIRSPVPDGMADSGPVGSQVFSSVSMSAKAAEAEQGLSQEVVKQMTELEKYDPLDPRRVDILEKLAQQAQTAADRAMWYQQIADTLSAAAQSGSGPNGVKRLESLHESLQKAKADKAILAYVRFRTITAEHTQRLQSPKVDYAKIQTEFNRSLEQFIADYPTAPDAAEAMLQLAIAHEFEGREDDAKKWYSRVVSGFAGTPPAMKAKGATLRLDSVGKAISLSGKSITGEKLQLADYRGKVVLIHYWGTWSEPCKRDMATLKQLVANYGPQFMVLGVSLDNDAKAATAFLADHKLSWPQIHEQGGMDSPPANQLGILMVPMMLLVDPQGKVVNRAIQVAEIEPELKKLIR
jgi:peroxiredoxin